MGILNKILGDPNEREIKMLRTKVSRINDLEPELEKLTDDELRSKTVEFRERIEDGEELDDLLPEAFAVVREASKRTIGLRHFDVQMVGGIVLHQGKIAEMKTGEGKTLVATLPSYLNALPGEGVHVITVNDYLAKRDREWMGKIHEFLGLNVGVIYNAQNPQGNERQDSYKADITYGTNNEFGFDYLRDNMATDLSYVVQRSLNYAIVDEVDNILIDEARTPLIISGQGEESTDQYVRFAKIAPHLQEEEDYTVDEKRRTVSLTEEGIGKIERLVGVKNIYEEETFDLTRYMENAVKAEILFKRDRDYIVQDGEVIIVDEFTGRLMPGRRYNEGLHQAIEAKEGVKVQRENRTLATITFQNYFRLYNKLSGMTGTALTEAEEFFKIYKLDVIVIPTHRPMIRSDNSDLIYKTADAKFNAVVEEIKERHEKEQPVLVGTTSVELSEILSGMLNRQGIEHQVLNAKFHEKEAGIVSQAGRSGAVTIATNMAGRGTDILLGGNPSGLVDRILRERDIDPEFATEEDHAEALDEAKRRCDEDREKVVEAGGLYIIGTQRHDARRIDNQLRGRSGRQGDPGASRFYLSLEDDLMRRFAADRVTWVMDRVGMEEDIPIESKLVSKFIEQAQTKVEGYNFDIRKHVVEYDDVIARQREVIYADRYEVLNSADLKEKIQEMIKLEAADIVQQHTLTNLPEDWDLQGMVKILELWFPIPDDIFPQNLNQMKREKLIKKIQELAVESYDRKEQAVIAEAQRLAAPQSGEFYMRQFERWVTLRVVDSLWMDHIDTLDVLRSGISLRALAQRDPLVEFKREAFEMFERLKITIQRQIVEQIFRGGVPIETTLPPHEVAQNIQTNKQQIEDQLVQNTSTNGAQASAGLRVDQRARGFAAAANMQNGSGAPALVTKDAPPSAAKIGRNDPCYCGSGLKYKKCHGK